MTTIKTYLTRFAAWLFSLWTRLALWFNPAPTRSGPRPHEPVWTGRKRPSFKGGHPLHRHGDRAPKGYAYNGRGDLVKLSREVMRRGGQRNG